MGLLFKKYLVSFFTQWSLGKRNSLISLLFVLLSPLSLLKRGEDFLKIVSVQIETSVAYFIKYCRGLALWRALYSEYFQYYFRRYSFFENKAWRKTPRIQVLIHRCWIFRRLLHYTSRYLPAQVWSRKRDFAFGSTSKQCTRICRLIGSNIVLTLV